MGEALFFFLLVASFPSDSEVEQGGGGVCLFEPTLPKVMRLASC